MIRNSNGVKLGKDGRVSDSPSIVELLRRLARLEAVVAGQTARNAALETENTELRRRLEQNSRNPSRLPPSDSPYANLKNSRAL